MTVQPFSKYELFSTPLLERNPLASRPLVKPHAAVKVFVLF